MVEVLGCPILQLVYPTPASCLQHCSFFFFFLLGTKKDGIGDWPHVPSTSLFSQIWKGLQHRCIKLGWQKEMFGLGMASSALNLSRLSFLHFPMGAGSTPLCRGHAACFPTVCPHGAALINLHKMLYVVYLWRGYSLCFSDAFVRTASQLSFFQTGLVAPWLFVPWCSVGS